MASLQEQFHLIQQQQRERYENQKSLKLNARSSSGPRGSGPPHRDLQPENIPPTLEGKADSLDLATVTQGAADNVSGVMAEGDPDLLTPGDRGQSRELTYLCGQLEKLQLENSSLKSDMRGRERELAELQKTREEERAALRGGGSTATQKIVELSKKNRELSAELATERNRVRQSEKKLREAEKLSAETAAVQAPATTNQVQPKGSVSSSTVVTDNSAALQEQLRQSKQKLAEYRNQCQLLKQDLRLAHKVLAKEVGEGASVASLLSNPSGWRGRSQQILSLQSKVAELKEQLSAIPNRPQKRGEGGRIEAGVPRMGEESATRRLDARQKAALHKMESARKKNLEETQQELQGLRSDHAALQQQCGALKSRNKTLSCDVRSMKSQIATLSEKSSKDGRLIASLTRENATSTSVVSSQSTDLNGSQWQQWQEENSQLAQANRTLQEQLSKCLYEIQSLRETNREGIPISRTHRLQSENDPMTQPEFSLPPIVQSSNPVREQKLTGNRPKCSRKSASAGGLVLVPTLDQQPGFDLTEAQTLAKVALAERDRLMELTTSLQQRLDASTDKLVRLETEARNLRIRGRQVKQSGRVREHGSKPKLTSEEGTGCPDSVLEDQVMLLRDETAVLRETLELTRQERMEDLEHLQCLLQETKQLFVESIRKLKCQVNR